MMSVDHPDVIVISSDDEGDGDCETNLDEGVEAENDREYIDLDTESDKEEEDDVAKSIEEECVDNNCDERRDRSDPSNQGGNDLQEQSLYECKTYLRKHGMRVSGTKEECIQRIKEHERLKDGRGESFYPRSSFTINCSGDVCRGDVLFKQNMYNSQRNIIGRRTIAGRILKESYGASTQHTFSVEVLWSKWSKKLNPLSILLVKGRNLYRYGTFRQPWNSEAERSEVLREKHERGKAARRKRKLRVTEFASGDNKGTKRRKVSSSQTKHTSRIDKHNDVIMNTKAHNQAVWFQNTELEKSLQLTCHSDPNSSMNSVHDVQEASLSFSCDRTLLPNKLLPFGSADYSHYNNGQQGPDQTFSQPPDHHHQNSEPIVHRSTDERFKLRFPKSSFSIKCTGDAREGDVVLYKQLLYLGGKKLQKKRTVAGTVAGRIVKKVRKCESSDKHKFLIKVLWTAPSINRRRCSTLLVRSRILYKLGTFRQPRKHEATNMFEQKHAPAPTPKWKLKNIHFASNKNKGKKREKVSHNGPSSSKQPTQKAKNKSSKRKGANATDGLSSSKQATQKAKDKASKRKGASATPVKETKTGHKRKAVHFQKTKSKKSKQTFHLDLNPDTNLNLRLNPNPNPISSTTSNLNLDTRSNPNPNTGANPNPNPNPNPNTNTGANPNPNPNTNPNTHQNPNPNPNTRTHLNLNTHTNPNPNPNMKPHPNSWLYHDHQLQGPSLSFLHDRIFMPNHPPIGSSSDQPPVWFQPSQPPSGLPGYGQCVPNHGFVQPPDYYDHNRLLLKVLAALWCQQPR